MWTRHYHLPLETGEAVDDAGAPVAWAACPALPGAYEEAPTAEGAREALRALARRIIAEHLMRDDPLDPDITAGDASPAGPHPNDVLIVAVGEADVEEARNAPMLIVEQPEP